MKQYNYKCVVTKNGVRMYYKRVHNKWKRITNAVGMKAEKRKRKFLCDCKGQQGCNNCNISIDIISSFKGQTSNFIVSKNITLKILKEELENIVGIKPKNMQIYFGSLMRNDEKTLKDYGMEDGAAIHVDKKGYEEDKKEEEEVVEEENDEEENDDNFNVNIIIYELDPKYWNESITKDMWANKEDNEYTFVDLLENSYDKVKRDQKKIIISRDDFLK